MKKKIISILIALCMTIGLMPTTVWAVQDATKNAAKTNFGLTNEKVNYVYLNNQSASKAVFLDVYPHFIEAGSGIYHLHGNLKANSDIDVDSRRPNNIEVKAGGTVKLLFDGTLDGSEGLVWDYSAFKSEDLYGEYGMVKIKNGKESKQTNLEVHFAGKCTISAPIYNAVIHSYGAYGNLTIVLHDDCDVTLKGGDFAAAVGGAHQDDGRNITITTDGKYDTNGNRISYKGNGKLTCIGGDQAAGIGSSYWGYADNITINSGTVIAKGGYGSAGIGSAVHVPSSEHPLTNKASNIKINGGNVYAVGGDSAAGIGSGDYSNVENISITGGTVTAIGGEYAAGIGGGSSGNVKNISISGGDITATGGKGGAGIGGGYSRGASNITISGGKIKAILKENYGAYPIGRGHINPEDSEETADYNNNNMIKVPDNTKVSFATKLVKGNIYNNMIYSLDSFNMDKEFGFFLDEKNYALNSVEINFESCKDHTLNWYPGLKYQYCSNCQSVKAYDDVAPTLSGIEDSVVFGSWVKFKADDAGQRSSKDITHNYKVGNELRSVLFRSVPYTETGISKVTVSTYSYDADRKAYSILEGEETLTEIDNDNGKKSYQFKGANCKTEYLNYQKAQTSEEKAAALKAQRITVEDCAGNTVNYDVYAFLSHRIECYIDGDKQIIDEEKNRDYIDVIDGGGVKITFLKDKASTALGYQFYYYVTVNGTRIPTTEDNVYEFDNVREDLEVNFDLKLDKTAPFLTVKINNDSYDSTQSGNDDLSKCKKLNTGATVTLIASDIATAEEPASGIMESSLEYLISEKPMTAEELKNATGWKKYDGDFKLPDSKTSIVYARVKDIARNITYAASVPYLPDETVPIINGLEEGKIYCGEVTFSASDANGIAEVKAGDSVLTPDSNGKYTLAAGTGKVTVTVTDKAQHSTTVTVTVNAGHTLEDDDGDCTTAIKCTVCHEDAVAAKESHNYGNDWKADRPGTTHSRVCKNDGCTVTDTQNCHGGTATCKEQAVCADCKESYGKFDPSNHSGEKQWLQTEEQHSQIWNCCNEVAVPYEPHEWKDGVCTECGYACKHNGGIATCTEQAICTICGQHYGEYDTDNHTGELQWVQTAEEHSKRWNCCNKVEVPYEPHKWEDGVCTECGCSCRHNGGTATCTEQAICAICGEHYGEYDTDNHTGELQWVKNTEQHSKRWSCCDTAVVPYEPHEWKDGVCTECGYTCEHSGGTATCTEKAVCVICGEQYGDILPHSYSTDWKFGDTTHWYECAACGAKTDEAEHIYDNDCDTNCNVCGATRDITHSYKDDWSSDENSHWHECTVCGNKKDEEKHIAGAEATETTPQICTVCGYVIHEALGHEHSYTVENTDAQYLKSAATCTEKAVYFYSCSCGEKGTETFEYGDLLNHIDKNNDHNCDMCGKTLTEHSGGTATCTDKAVCSICGKSYGELDAKNHSNLKHIDAKAATEIAEGNIEYWYCDGCNRYFADENGNKEITKADTVIAKLDKKDDNGNNNSNNSSNNNSDNSYNSQSPKTGDNRRVTLWLVLAILTSGSVITTILINKKRKCNK